MQKEWHTATKPLMIGGRAGGDQGSEVRLEKESEQKEVGSIIVGMVRGGERVGGMICGVGE